jgi:hypothetical protein
MANWRLKTQKARLRKTLRLTKKPSRSGTELQWNLMGFRGILSNRHLLEVAPTITAKTFNVTQLKELVLKIHLLYLFYSF